MNSLIFVHLTKTLQHHTTTIQIMQIWSYIKNLFNEADESSPIRPFIHETIERGELELAAYENWKSDLARNRFVNSLGDEYATYRIDPSKVDRSLDFLDTPSMKGFVIHASIGKYKLVELKHLLDYLKERVLTANYYVYVSDRRIYNRDGKNEMIERHYLKPKAKMSENELFSQGYGNVRIELKCQNDLPINLKFSATGYSDRLFEETEDFRILMSILTG